MSFETELSDRLHAGVDDTPVDLEPLLTGSIAYGNKLVRRRRLARILGGAATIAVLGGAFAYAGALNDPASTTPAPAGTSTAAALLQTKAVTPQAALKLLLDKLPDKSKAKGYMGWPEGVGKQDGVSAQLKYTDNGSTADVRISLLENRSAPKCVKGVDQACHLTRLSDGSQLQLVENQSSGSSGNYKHLQANLYRKDGLVITLLSENREEFNPNTSPTAPPISLTELKALAIGVRWQRQLPAAFVDSAEGLFTPQPLAQPSATTTK